MEISATSPFFISRYGCCENTLFLEMRAGDSYHVFTIKPVEILLNNFIQYTFTHNSYCLNVLKESRVKTFMASPMNTLGFYMDNILLNHAVENGEKKSVEQLNDLKVIHNTFTTGNNCIHIERAGDDSNRKIITKSHAKWAFLIDDNRLLEMGLEYDDFMDTFDLA